MDISAVILAIESSAALTTDQKQSLVLQLLQHAQSPITNGDANLSANPAQATQEANQAVNIAALRGTGGASSYMPGTDLGASLAPAVLAKAAAYEPTPPVNDNGAGALKWAYDNYLAAGMIQPGPGIPNNAMDRFGPMLAYMGGNAAVPSQIWVDAFKAVIVNYATGSAGINSGPTPAELAAQWAAVDAKIASQVP